VSHRVSLFLRNCAGMSLREGMGALTLQGLFKILERGQVFFKFMHGVIQIDVVGLKKRLEIRNSRNNPEAPPPPSPPTSQTPPSV
jgi:hypothetical protein